MRCSKAERLISRRLDGRLSSREAAALDRHLAECERCRRAAELLQQAWRALAPLEATPPAPDDWRQIETAVEARRRRWTPSWLPWQLPPAPAAAAWMLLAGIALGATGGVLISRAALAPGRSVPMEARMFAETMGELPWGSPAAGLGGVLDARTAKERAP